MKGHSRKLALKAISCKMEGRQFMQVVEVWTNLCLKVKGYTLKLYIMM